MVNIAKLKINCTSIAALISSSQGNNPPTEKQWKDFFNTVNKPVEKLTSKQMYDIKNIVMKQVDYSPDDLSERCFILGVPDEEIKQRCDFLKSNMTYDNIPDELKLIRITLQKNSLRIKEARNRVKLARKWVADLHDKIEKNVALAKK